MILKFENDELETVEVDTAHLGPALQDQAVINAMSAADNGWKSEYSYEQLRSVPNAGGTFRPETEPGIDRVFEMLT